MRKFFIFLAALSALFGDAINDKVRALVDPQSYVTHQKLIEIIFKNKKEFLAEPDRADSVKVAATLKENGLLDIFYKEGPRNLSATFRSTKSPMFFLKAVSDSLSDLGYNFTRLSAMRSDSLFFEWTISYRSDHAIDPAQLSKRLAAFRVKIDDISKQGDDWRYLISAKNPNLPEATALEIKHTSDDPLLVQNMSGEYWVKLPPYSSNASRVGIRKKSGGSWVVYAVFYDEALQPIQTAVSANSVKAFISPFPENAAYLKITDNDIAVTLQHGLQFWIEVIDKQAQSD
ncbi:MAG: hypothetical protein LBC09_06125 [Helicobacteraceae bacterium]|jgi:hypothetical protein|nr:hypothetical protein [Helicobacteraceae bacterium]